MRVSKVGTYPYYCNYYCNYMQVADNKWANAGADVLSSETRGKRLLYRYGTYRGGTRPNKLKLICKILPVFFKLEVM